MPSELHIQLVQQLQPFENILEKQPENAEDNQWAGRSVSKVTEIKSEIKRLLLPEKFEDITDNQLLNRVCTLCDVDSEKKNLKDVL